jgi:hypothetical protein
MLAQIGGAGAIKTIQVLDALKEEGFVEGQNVVIDYRSGDDQPERLPVLAADLVRRKVAVLVTRRVKVLLAGLVALLGLSGAGLVYRQAIAREIMAQDRWRMGAGPTVLTVEQEKAKAGKPGSHFRECANGCPAMIVIPADKNS